MTHAVLQVRLAKRERHLADLAAAYAFGSISDHSAALRKPAVQSPLALRPFWKLGPPFSRSTSPELGPPNAAPPLVAEEGGLRERTSDARLNELPLRY